MNGTAEKIKTASEFVSQLLPAILIISVNLAWFLPTVSSMRRTVSEAQKLVVEKSLISTEAFFEDKELDIKVPARYITLPIKSAENEKIIRKILKEDYFISAALIDGEGNEVFKYNKHEFVSPSDFKYVSSRSDFQSAVKEGKAAWSRVKISPTFEPFITITVPVISSSGDAVGAISAEFSLQLLFKKLEEGVDTQSGEKIYVTDDSGLLVSHTDSSLVLRNTNYYDRSIVKDSIVKKDVVSADDDTYTYVNEDGVKVLAAAGHYADPSLIIVYETPRQDTLSSIRRIEVFFVAVFLFISFMVLGLRRVNVRAVKASQALQKSLNEQKKLVEAVGISKKNLEEANRSLEGQEKELKQKVAELEKFQKLTTGRELAMIELKRENEELKKQLTGNN